MTGGALGNIIIGSRGHRIMFPVGRGDAPAVKCDEPWPARPRSARPRSVMRRVCHVMALSVDLDTRKRNPKGLMTGLSLIHGCVMCAAELLHHGIAPSRETHIEQDEVFP